MTRPLRGRRYSSPANRLPPCTAWIRAQTRDFYTDVLSFEPGTDITMGEGFGWVTVKHPGQPELEITPSGRLRPSPAGRRRDGWMGLSVDNRRKTFKEFCEKGGDLPAGAVRPAARR